MKEKTRSSSRNTKVTLIQPRNDFRDAQGMLRRSERNRDVMAEIEIRELAERITPELVS